MHSQNWIIDYRSIGRANMYRVRDAIVSTTSRFQEVLIADTFDHGRALFLDGIPQSSSVDEHIYHEALVHPVLIANDTPEQVFIAGGGEGAIVREVLKHNTIKQVTMVDIDETVVNLARQYLDNWHQGTFDDPRVQILHEDARDYLMTHDEKFDCIIVDMTDPLEGSPAALLFTYEFYEIAKARLKTGGTFAMQGETTNIGEHIAHISIVKTLRKSFNSVMPYQTWIPFYGLAWGFIIAGDLDLEARFASQSVDLILQRRNCLNLQFYDEETHTHMFALPKHLRKGLSDPDFGSIIYDNVPLVVE